MKHLTQEQRYKIEIYYVDKYSYAQIGEKIGKDKSVVYREIKRNCDKRNGVYRAALAQRKAELRLREKPKRIRFTQTMKQNVIADIKRDYSPEQIAGRAKLKGLDCVSHERIYQFIWADKKAGGKLYKHLRTKGKRYAKRGSLKGSRGLIRDRVGIDQRPAVVEDRHRFGDFEIDLVIGKDHKEALLTTNDRSTGLLIMGHVSSKSAAEIQAKTIELLEPYKPLLHTITSDNGKEFANHVHISNSLDISYYFAQPYASWERGSNENLNGLVRQYFPKKSDFTLITAQQIKEVENKLNNRPRKRFGFKTPNEMMAEKLNNSYSVAFVT